MTIKINPRTPALLEAWEASGLLHGFLARYDMNEEILMLEKIDLSIALKIGEACQLINAAAE